MNPDEKTLPELLKEQGYATAIIGKWHLGNQDLFQPLNQGFDRWYGTPASNSQGFDPNTKRYADDCVWREGYTKENILKLDEAKCPLVRDNLVIEVPADQTQFTQRYTREAIRFITEHQDKPFFLYLPHNMAHTPLHASAGFVGKTKLGIYGDAIQELDWSTGEILKTLRDLGLDDKTLVVFASDTGGPICDRGSHALDMVHLAMGWEKVAPQRIEPTTEAKNSWDRGVKLYYPDGTVIRLESSDGPAFGGIFIGERGKMEINRGRFACNPTT